MAQVRKTPDTPPAPAVVHDISDRRRRGSAPAGDQSNDLPAKEGPRPPAVPRESRAAKAARIAELKRQIEQGEYNPDPDEIARKMLERGF